MREKAATVVTLAGSDRTGSAFVPYRYRKLHRKKKKNASDLSTLYTSNINLHDDTQFMQPSARRFGSSIALSYEAGDSTQARSYYFVKKEDDGTTSRSGLFSQTSNKSQPTSPTGQSISPTGQTTSPTGQPTATTGQPTPPTGQDSDCIKDTEAGPGRTLPTLQHSQAEQTQILSPQPEPDKHHCECSEDIQPFCKNLRESIKEGSVEKLQLVISQAGAETREDLIEDGLLYAIDEDQIDIVKHLLDEREAASESSSVLHHVQDKDNDNPDYSPYITPTILAATLERKDILRLIIDRDECEIHPITIEKCTFDVEDDCEICISQKNVFKNKCDFEDSLQLLEIYRALSSPAYIFQSGVRDPITEAFMLNSWTRKLQEDVPSLKVEYMNISKKCSQFSTEMLDLCRSNEELELILGKGKDVKFEMSRICNAVDLKQKEFIAHPYCQLALDKLWYEGLPDWVCETKLYPLMMFLYVLLWAPLWPVASLLYLFKLPGITRVMEYPINKFITNTLSYVTFLLLLFMNNVLYQQKAKSLIKLYFFNYIEWLLILWIIGLTVTHVKTLLRGYRHHKTINVYLGLVLFNRPLDTILLTCFWVWIMIRSLGVLHIEVNDNDKSILNDKWDHGVWFLLSETCLGFGTILAFVRCMGMFRVHYGLGPLHLSLKHMMKDVLMFLSLFLIIMTGFAVAITTINSNYGRNYGMKSVLEKVSGFQETFLTLFWTVFDVANIFDDGKGHIEPQVASVLAMDAPPLLNVTDDSDSLDIDRYNLAEEIVYFLMGGYQVVAKVVLLNMLIAMMANSFTAIQENSDREWKFARTSLRLKCSRVAGSLPPPFNLLWPIRVLLISLPGRCVEKCKAYLQQENHKVKQEEDKQEEMQRQEYLDLLKKLQERYWTRKRNSSRKCTCGAKS